MTDTCRVDRPNGRTALNEDTGKHEPIFEEKILELKCRVQALDLQADDAEVGAALIEKSRARIDVPWNTQGIAAGDRITVTGAGRTSPPGLMTVTYRVVAPIFKSRATALRLIVEVKR